MKSRSDYPQSLAQAQKHIAELEGQIARASDLVAQARAICAAQGASLPARKDMRRLGRICHDVQIILQEGN